MVDLERRQARTTGTRSAGYLCLLVLHSLKPLINSVLLTKIKQQRSSPMASLTHLLPSLLQTFPAHYLTCAITCIPYLRGTSKTSTPPRCSPRLSPRLLFIGFSASVTSAASQIRRLNPRTPSDPTNFASRPPFEGPVAPSSGVPSRSRAPGAAGRPPPRVAKPRTATKAARSAPPALPGPTGAEGRLEHGPRPAPRTSGRP